MTLILNESIAILKMRCCAQNKCQNDIQFLFGTLHMYSVHAYIKATQRSKGQIVDYCSCVWN